jgi:hypothetical protein
MCAIHDIVPLDARDEDDLILFKKLVNQEGLWDVVKKILGFCFHGGDKTILVSEGKSDALIATMTGWLRNTSKNANYGIPFTEFRSTLYKVRHAFLSIPAGRGLMSPFYRILGKERKVVFLHQNERLCIAVIECCIFLQSSISSPTKCRSLVAGWPYIIGVMDASKHGVGGNNIGEGCALLPTVFRFEWPNNIKVDLCSDINPSGSITNSDFKLAALLFLFLTIEAVAGDIRDKHIALYSDKSPSVHWVQRLAARHSPTAMQLIRALSLRLHITQASPLTTLHIAGQRNAMTDVPSRSFGSEAKWHCPGDSSFLTLYNSLFPLSTQESWSLFCLSSVTTSRVTLILRTKAFTLAEWRRLQKAGTITGPSGKPSSNLWEWYLSYRVPATRTGYECSQDLPPSSERATQVEDAKSQLQRSDGRPGHRIQPDKAGTVRQAHPLPHADVGWVAKAQPSDFEEASRRSQCPRIPMQLRDGTTGLGIGKCGG